MVTCLYRLMLLVLLACGAATFGATPARALQGWCTTIGSGGATGCYGSPMAACSAQHQVYAPDQAFYGYTDMGRWDMKQCQWHTGWFITYPTQTAFNCPPGYTAMPPGVCVNGNEPFPLQIATPESCGTVNNGGTPTQQTDKPIDILTGAKILRATDFASAGDTLKLERIYTSIAYVNSSYMRRATWGLGGNWRFTFQHELHLSTGFANNQTVELETAEGRSLNFTKDSSGNMNVNYYPYSLIKPTDYTLAFVGAWPSNPADVLTAPSQWQVQDSQDRIWLFQTYLDPASGQYAIAMPISVTFRGGLQWTFAYGTNHQLTSITDSFGNSISFTWIISDPATLGATGIAPTPLAVASASLPDGTSITYVNQVLDSTLTILPQADGLAQVKHFDASNNLFDSTTYLYENASYPRSVTGIVDFNGTRRWTVTYQSDGRAISSSGPNGIDQTTVSYTSSYNEFDRTVTNALGKSATYMYSTPHTSQDGVLNTINGAASTHCPASAAAFSYGSDQYIASTTDEEGRVTAYLREGRGLPTSITRGANTPQAVTTTYTWHATLHAPTQVVQPNLTTNLTWNTLGQLTQLTQTDTTTQTVPYSTNGQARAWTFTYGTGGRLTSVDGPLPGTGDTVTYAYNAQGYLQSVTNEVGLTTQVTAWNGRGLPTSITDPNGVVWSLGYDLLGRLTSVTGDPAGINAVTSITYNAVGDVTKITRPNGAYLQYTWDSGRRVTAVTDNSGASINYVLDALGNITSQTIKDANNNVQLAQTATFDELGRLLTFVGAAGQTWTDGYDKTDNLTSVTDPRSNVHQWAFDSVNRLVRETDEVSAQVNLTRNGKDEVTAYQDPRSLTTSYVRDGFGKVIQRTSPDTGTTVYHYSAAGKVTSITDGRGVTVNLAYDNAGRMLSKQYPAATAENITYTWDQTAGGNKGLGRLAHIDDASGSVQWVYDALGRVVQETKTTAGHVYTFNYGYDAAGNVIWMTYPSGRIVGYWRDALGRISGIATQASSTSPSITLAYNVSYMPFGPLQSLWYGSGLDLWKTFTQDYLLDVMLVENTSTSTTYINRAHTRTDNLNLTNIWDNVNSNRSESFWYTAAGRLQNASGLYGSLTYYYDGVGNRTYEILTQGATTTTNVYGYPSNNNLLGQITQGGTTVRSFTTDGAGNIITDNRAGPNYTYGYNNRGRLNQVTLGSTILANYTYDGLERLAIRTTQNVSSPGTSNYAYDRSGHLLVEASAAGVTTTEYVWFDDMPVAVFAGVDTGSPTLFYVHTDHLNRPIKMTDVNKNVVWDAIYWPFGAVYLITGSATNNLRFPGQYFLLESGLHYNWHRHYDPTIGRYLQADPRGFINGPSVYGYANSGPLIRIDPLGLWTIQIGGTVNFQFGPITLQFSAGIALDGVGNVGSYYTAGPGLGIGADISGGVSAALSSARTICGLAGPFLNQTFGGGFGPHGSADTFYGFDENGNPVTGAGGTFGIGVGAGASTTVTTTTVTPFGLWVTR